MWRILRYVLRCWRVRRNFCKPLAHIVCNPIPDLQVDSLAGKESIVINGLKSVRRDLDEFLSYFPVEVVEEARSRIATENELNFKEFDPSLGSILNPNPVSATKGG